MKIFTLSFIKTTKATTIPVSGSINPPIDVPSDPVEFCKVQEPGFYPHPTDCTAYYHCSEYNGYLYFCADGLVWNTNSNNCDWPYNFEC